MSSLSHTDMTGCLFVVTAASGTGKTSLVSALRQQLSDDGQPLALSISHTTRPSRPGEINGVHYHFVSQEDFVAQVNQGAFLEHAEVFGNYYGTSEAAVLACLQRGEDVLLEIDWQGAQQVRQRFPQSIQIFILPPSVEALAQRLSHRQQDSLDVIALRLSQSQAEMAHYVLADYLIVNDEFEIALQDLLAIVRANRLTQQRQATRHANLIEKLITHQ